MMLANTDHLDITDWVVLWVTDLGTRSWSMFNPEVHHLIKFAKILSLSLPQPIDLTVIVLTAVPRICW